MIVLLATCLLFTGVYGALALKTSSLERFNSETEAKRVVEAVSSAAREVVWSGNGSSKSVLLPALSSNENYTLNVSGRWATISVITETGAREFAEPLPANCTHVSKKPGENITFVYSERVVHAG